MIRHADVQGPAENIVQITADDGTTVYLNCTTERVASSICNLVNTCVERVTPVPEVA